MMAATEEAAGAKPAAATKGLATFRSYRVTATLALQPGATVRLNPAQARDRKHNLAPIGSGSLFKVCQPVEFKAGETVGLAAVAKTDLGKVVALETADASKPA
jgi:hypothetical protein